MLLFSLRAPRLIHNPACGTKRPSLPAGTEPGGCSREDAAGRSRNFTPERKESELSPQSLPTSV